MPEARLPAHLAFLTLVACLLAWGGILDGSCFVTGVKPSASANAAELWPRRWAARPTPKRLSSTAEASGHTMLGFATVSLVALGVAASHKKKPSQRGSAVPVALQALPLLTTPAPVMAFAGASFENHVEFCRFSEAATTSPVVMYGWKKELKPRRPTRQRRQKLDRSRGPLNYCPAKWKDKYYLRRAQKPLVSARKRFLIKEDGSIWRRQMGLSHLISKKGTKRIKRLEKLVRLLPCHLKKARRLLRVNTPTKKPWDFIMKKFPEKRVKDTKGMEDRLIGTRMWTTKRHPDMPKPMSRKCANLEPIEWGPDE